MITRDGILKALGQALKSANGARRPSAPKTTTGFVSGGGRRPFVGTGGPKRPAGGCACSGSRK